MPTLQPVLHFKRYLVVEEFHIDARHSSLGKVVGRECHGVNQALTNVPEATAGQPGLPHSVRELHSHAIVRRHSLVIFASHLNSLVILNVKICDEKLSEPDPLTAILHFLTAKTRRNGLDVEIFVELTYVFRIIVGEHPPSSYLAKNSAE